jgi:AraC family transcriptional regulator of adaptative response / DNA-3-methyladenine glycosylase II
MKALGMTSPAKVLAEAERWRPWRAYAVMHLWHTLSSSEPRARSRHAASIERN